MNSKNPVLDAYFANAKKWHSELSELRSIVLDCGLTEEQKWKQPCYTINDSNVLIIASFKDFCAISFLKGVLLGDTEGILEKPGENSQSVRFAKFTDLKTIVKLAPVLKAYIFEAIEVEKAGLKVELKEHKDLVLAAELLAIFAKDPELQHAFESLTPGRQRAYNMFFTAAKQSTTRVARIEKYRGRILNGKGINDCVCGLSKKMPNCDGSHKLLKES